MNNIHYGLISPTDARTLEKTIDLIIADREHKYINVTEIGIYNGETSRGLREYINSKGFEVNYTAIDNEKDKPVDPPFEGCNLIIGNSNEVYWKIPYNSQHLIFVDGCHCFAHVVSDFFCYADRVNTGGYLAFHDTGQHIKPFKDFQHGDRFNPDAYISVRNALDKIELFKEWGGVNIGNGPATHRVGSMQWQLIFDEADPNDEAGGVCVFKKLY